MKVLLVSDHHPPDANGHAVAAAWWARVMAEAPGVEIQVLHPHSDAWRGHATLRRLPPPDLLHLHGHGLLVGAALRRFPRLPAIAQVHQFAEGAGAPPVPGLEALLRARQRWVLRRAGRVAAPSHLAAAKVRALLPSAEVRVLPTGVGPEVAAAARKADGAPWPTAQPAEGAGPAAAPRTDGGRPMRILYVGRRSRDKGFPDFAHLASLHPEAEWLAMGSGAARPAGVRLLPHGGQAEVAARIAAADVLFNPSLLETQGLAALESLTLGTPVVAPEGTAQAELLRPGLSGQLYPPGDLDAAWLALRAAARLPRGGVRPPGALDEATLRQDMLALYRDAVGR